MILQGRIFFSLLILCPFHHGFAQRRQVNDTERQRMIDTLKLSSKVFILPAHTEISKVSWRDSIYRFPSFEYGRITLATGYSPEEKLKFNYNLYFGQMLFVNSRGDTVQVKRSKELKLIAIRDHLFYHDERVGYIEIILRLPVALGVWKILSSPGDELRGSSTNYDRYYRIWGRYYFLDKDNKLYNPNKHSILKLFYDHKKKLNAYLDETSIDFEREDDLIKLLTFCNALEK